MSDLRHVASLLALLVSLLAFVALAGMLVVVTYRWIIGPFVLAARTAKSPSRFLLSDLGWLVLQLQLAMGLMSYALPADMETSVRIVALVLWCLAATVLWAAGLHMVSQSGIGDALRRGIVYMVLLPGLVVVLFGAPLPVIQSIDHLSADGSRTPLEPGLVMIGSEAAALMLLAVALGWLARWTIATRKLPLPQGFVKQDRGGG